MSDYQEDINIAAAPELLRACEVALKRMTYALSLRVKLVGHADQGQLVQEVEQLKQAIAHAKGLS